VEGISAVQFGVSQVGAAQLAAAGVSPTLPAGGPVSIGATPGASGPYAMPAGGSVGAAGGRHHHRPHAMATAVDAAAKLLGTSTTDVLAALKSGGSLASLASSVGVGQDATANAIATALQQSDPSLSASDATQVAERLVTATRPNAGSGGSQFGIVTSQSGSSTVSFGA
jgi:hypothetical protein